MKRTPLSSRFCVLLLIFAIVWFACGAPIFAEEWHAVPDNLARLFRQIPGRAAVVWRNWLSGGLAIPAALAETRRVELPLRVWDAENGCVFSVLLEDYVAGVVAAEMPAAYHIEALKCQAVAARTRAAYACRALGGNGCATHADCDLCTDPACCQGWRAAENDAACWGAEAGALRQRVTSAGRSTAGQILTYGGLPIEVLYHACSGGRTEDASAVFASAQPYLISVKSPGEENHPGYAEDRRFTRAAAAAILTAAFPGCGVSAGDLPGQIKLLSSTESGRMDTVLVGLQTVTGRDLRKALGLRSTLCTWDADDESITFHTRGYGHGVGMSQAGAQAMAATGKSYAAVLAYYYPGTTLALLPPLE